MNTTPFVIIAETVNSLYIEIRVTLYRVGYFSALVITSVFNLIQIFITYNSVKDTVYPPVN